MRFVIVSYRIMLSIRSFSGSKPLNSKSTCDFITNYKIHENSPQRSCFSYSMNRRSFALQICHINTYSSQFQQRFRHCKFFQCSNMEPNYLILFSTFLCSIESGHWVDSLFFVSKCINITPSSLPSSSSSLSSTSFI